MKRLRLYKEYEYLFQALCWIVMIIPQMFMIHPNDHADALYYLLWMIEPLNIMIMFYANYLVLVPKYLMKKRFTVFSVGIIVLLLILSYGNHAAHIVLMKYEFPFRGRPFELSAIHNISAFLVRNIFPQLITVIMAVLLHMSKRWYQAETARHAAEIQKKDAELKNLRLQINPHFLLNTLNGIYALTESNPQKAQKAVASLSVLLRQMLYGSDKDKIKLREEAKLISNYVELMRMRLLDSVKVEVDIDIPDSGNLYVAPLIFITLAENAFKHGVSSSEPSFVHIAIHGGFDKIECEIRNSNFPKTYADKSGHGIGLRQLKERLDILYPGKYQWDYYLSENKTIYTSKLIIYDTKLCNY